MLSEYLESLIHLSITIHHCDETIIQALFNFGVKQGVANIQGGKSDHEKGEDDANQVVCCLNDQQEETFYRNRT